MTRLQNHLVVFVALRMHSSVDPCCDAGNIVRGNETNLELVTIHLEGTNLKMHWIDGTGANAKRAVGLLSAYFVYLELLTSK